jgi:hypothetical protein
MSAVMSEQPVDKRTHLPSKVLGENFYPFMYGRYRHERIQLMGEARRSTGNVRAMCVKQARHMNREGLWYLRRIEPR